MKTDRRDFLKGAVTALAVTQIPARKAEASESGAPAFCLWNIGDSQSVGAFNRGPLLDFLPESDWLLVNHARSGTTTWGLANLQGLFTVRRAPFY